MKFPRLPISEELNIVRGVRNFYHLSGIRHVTLFSVALLLNRLANSMSKMMSDQPLVFMENTASMLWIDQEDIKRNPKKASCVWSWTRKSPQPARGAICTGPARSRTVLLIVSSSGAARCTISTNAIA